MKAPQRDPRTGGPVDPNSVRLRDAGAGDAGFAESLYLRTMLPLLTDLGCGDEGRLRVRFARSYKQARSKIAQVAGADIGWLQVSTHPASLHLDQLHLLPDWWGRGIGGHLLAGLLDRAARGGCSVGLDVIRGNRAIALYRRLGFRVVGEDEEKFMMLWRPVPMGG